MAEVGSQARSVWTGSSSASALKGLGARLRRVRASLHRLETERILGRVDALPAARLQQVEAEVARVSQEIDGWTRCEAMDIAAARTSRVAPWFWRWQARTARQHIESQQALLADLRAEAAIITALLSAGNSNKA